VTFDVVEEPMSSLPAYADVPTMFAVERMVDVVASADGGWILTERPVDPPYIKDYDVGIDCAPADWPRCFDVSNWRLLVARLRGRRVGGAAIALDAARVSMPGEGHGAAVVWDIRVRPEMRAHGIGSALLSAAERWAAAKGCSQIGVETQNINVAACRLYARHGYQLAEVHQFAYAEYPDEIQLLWSKRLPDAGPHPESALAH
jgi:GNAT superfamily N-acetyltransferase